MPDTPAPDPTNAVVSNPVPLAPPVSPNAPGTPAAPPQAAQPDASQNPTPDNSQSLQDQSQTSQAPSTASISPQVTQTAYTGGTVNNPTPAPSKLGLPAPPMSTVPANTPNAGHPLVQQAGVTNSVALALAGGQRYKTTIDPNTGDTTRTPIPMTRAQVGLAIAMQFLSGAAASASASGPNHLALAAQAGLAQGQRAQQQRQEANQADQAQAQADANNKTAAFVRAAQIHEVNSRILLNTSEVEQRGADAIDKAVAINRQSGVLDTDSSNLENNGVPMTQNESIDAMKKGQINTTAQMGPIAGREEVTDADGSRRWEATHLIIKDPSTPTQLTQDDWDRYAAAGVPGYKAGTQIGPAGATVKLSMKQQANEQVISHDLAQQRLDDLHTTLEGTPLADKVPTSIDFTRPGVTNALRNFQKYVSHDSTNLSDPYLALQQMGADRRDPKTGEMANNPDAKYVDTVASAMGGWPVLEAAHNQQLANKKNAESYSIIDSTDKANAVLASPKRFSPDQIASARGFVALTAQQGSKKTSEDARARAVAEGTDVQAMYKFGKNPITGEVLSLTNAPPAMLVDSSGNVIPQDMVSTYKPTAQQRQTGDTARQVLSISDGLRQAVAANPNLAGPLSGRDKQGLAKLGLGDAQSQKYLDDLSFLQSASTKMHTGRFSSEIMKKMDNVIFPGMNPGQFNGALDSITGVAGRYADEDKLTTIANYKSQQTKQIQATPAPRIVPPGATPGRDSTGNVIGYRLANGQVVKF